MKKHKDIVSAHIFIFILNNIKFLVKNDFFNKKTSQRLQNIVRRLIDNQYFSLAEKLIDAIRNNPNLEEALAFANARIAPILLESEAAEKHIKQADRVPLYWAQMPYAPNLGDSLNPWLIKRLCEAPPRFTLPKDGAMLCIGSIAEQTKNNSQIWGSGLMFKDDKINPLANYHAVRGPITREIVLNNGGTCPEIYGDPGILMPLLFPMKNYSPDRIGVILHHSHQSNPEIRSYFSNETNYLISVFRLYENDFEKFVEELSCCSYIFTTSLHGFILARAYGIPARLGYFPEHPLLGDGMKFDDYLQGVGVKNHKLNPVDFSQLKYFSDEELKSHRIDLDPVEFNCEDLLSAFPYQEKLSTKITQSNKSVFA